MLAMIQDALDVLIGLAPLVGVFEQDAADLLDRLGAKVRLLDAFMALSKGVQASQQPIRRHLG